MANKPFVGDIGTYIVLDVGIDISGSTVSILVKKPNSDDIVEWDAFIGPNDATTSIVHIVKSGDFDVSGLYRVRAKVQLESGEWLGVGDWAEFRVYA